MARTKISKTEQSLPVCIVTGSAAEVRFERVDFVFAARGGEARDLSAHFLPRQLLGLNPLRPVEWTTLSLPFTEEGFTRFRKGRLVRRLLYLLVPALLALAFVAAAMVNGPLGYGGTELGRTLTWACALPFVVVSSGLAVFLAFVPPRGVHVVKDHLREIELDVPSELAAAMIGRARSEAREDRLAGQRERKRARR